MNEKELRKKIRNELKEKHENSEQKSNTKSHKKIKDSFQDASSDTQKQEFLKESIRQTIEIEICSKHPEMIHCENHLGETKWLTPHELNGEYEYYPVQESRFSKIRNRFLKPEKIKIPESEEWSQYLMDLRLSIEEDVKKRITFYIEKQTESRKQLQTEIEAEIYEEEMDKFYKSKKGYKKYKNHLGEYRWMTKEEADNQDEFFEEEPSLTQTWIVRFTIVAAILVAIFSFWQITTSSQDEDQKAILIVELNEDRGSLYIDQNLALGFKANEPYPITLGPHEISIIRSGYVSIPKVQQVLAQAEDTVRIAFDFHKQETSDMGFVRINSGGIDGGILINDDFYGNVSSQNLIAIKPGSHSIRLEKAGYTSNPFAQDIDLNVGDTINLRFELRAKRKTSSASATSGSSNFGLIEIRSNVKNADIFINGEKSEYRTDYVLQKIPYGQYVISIKKDGYKVYPEEQVAKINNDQSRAIVDFTLSSTTRQVILKTEPVAGEIFINGKSVGKGTFKGSLPLGQHNLSFGQIPYYNKPEDQIIEITQDGSNQYNFDYSTNFNIQFSTLGISPTNLSGKITTGHIFKNPILIPDPENGPERKSLNSIDSEVWYLGYTFQYRNPPGSDAIEFEFVIPDNIDLSQPIILKIWGYRSDSNYPLVVRGNAYYQIMINNNTFRGQVLPKYGEKEISENNYDEYVINEFLRSGFNKILLSTVVSTSAEFVLWKIAIE